MPFTPISKPTISGLQDLKNQSDSINSQLKNTDLSSVKLPTSTSNFQKVNADQLNAYNDANSNIQSRQTNRSWLSGNTVGDSDNLGQLVGKGFSNILPSAGRLAKAVAYDLPKAALWDIPHGIGEDIGTAIRSSYDQPFKEEMARIKYKPNIFLVPDMVKEIVKSTGIPEQTASRTKALGELISGNKSIGEILSDPQFLESETRPLVNLAKMGIEDPVGTALLVEGAIKAIPAVDKAVSKTAGLLEKGIGKVGSAIGETSDTIASFTPGVLTGKGAETFKQALNPTEEFYKAMRGETTASDIIKRGEQGVSSIKKMRSAEYGKELESLASKSKSLDISPVLDKTKELFNKFNIMVDADGTPNFSRSPLMDFQNQVNGIVDILSDWGSQSGDRTIKGVDTLRQLIRDFRGTDPKLNYFVDDLANEIKAVGKTVPGYESMLKKYEGYSDFLDEIKGAMSLGANTTDDAKITRLQQLLTDNKSYRRELANQFANITGTDLQQMIAGYNLRSYTPQGLGKYFATAGLSASAATRNIPALIMTLANSSPRIMGEFFGALGVGREKAIQLIDDINNLRLEKFVPKLPEKPGFRKGSFTPFEDINPKQDLPEVGAEGEYLYHGTNETLLDSITKDGLKPMGRNVTSLSKDESYARSFAESSKFPRKEGQGIMLRVKADAVNTTPSISNVPGDKLNELLTNQTISPKDIEILKDGKWQPLKNNPLIAEARKYKTAEEFVKAQGTPVYHASKNIIKEFGDIPDSGTRFYGKGTYFSKNVDRIKEFGDNIIEARLNFKNPYTEGDIYNKPMQDQIIKLFGKKQGKQIIDSKIILDATKVNAEKLTEMYKKSGYDGIIARGGNDISVFNPKDNVKTKSQLTDIWNKANKK